MDESQGASRGLLQDYILSSKFRTLVKFVFSLSPCVLVLSWWNFAYVMTAVLSWHMQNSFMIWLVSIFWMWSFWNLILSYWMFYWNERDIYRLMSIAYKKLPCNIVNLCPNWYQHLRNLVNFWCPIIKKKFASLLLENFEVIGQLRIEYLLWYFT